MTSPLDAAVLRDRDGKEITGASLWRDGPVLVVCLRRPGCLLCRDEAIHIWSERARFEAAGVRLVCVLHEWREAEVAAFAPAYWGGELYFNPGEEFHAAVHGGKIKRGSLLALLNPWGRALANAKRVKAAGRVKESNLTGDGLTLGGVMVVERGGRVAYSFAEETFGDAPPFDELLAAAAAAGGKAG